MNEHSYIRSIHKKLHSDVYRWKINDAYAGGVADAFYSGPNGMLFVEYKYISEKKLPKRGTTLIVPDLSGLQKKWLRDRHEESIPVVVVLGTPQASVIFTHCEWEKGILTSQLGNIEDTSNMRVAEFIEMRCLGEKPP